MLVRFHFTILGQLTHKVFAPYSQWKIKMHNIWHSFVQIEVILTSLALWGHSYNNSVTPQKSIFIYISIQFVISSPMKSILISRNFTHATFCLLSLQFPICISLRVWLLAQTRVQTQFPPPILLERSASLQKLWRAAGMVRGCQYQIGHTKKSHLQ